MEQKEQTNSVEVWFPYLSELVDKLVEKTERRTLIITELEMAIIIVKHHWKHPEDDGYGVKTEENEKVNLLCDALVDLFSPDEEDEDCCPSLDCLFLINKFFAYLDTPQSMRDF